MNLSADELYEIARYQAFVWTIADGACVAFVLLILDLVRERFAGGRRAWFRWSLLAASLLLWPWVFLAPERREFFFRECVTVSLQFAALLISIVDAPLVWKAVAALETGIPGGKGEKNFRGGRDSNPQPLP